MSMVYLLSVSISLSTLILTKAKNITLMIGGEFMGILDNSFHNTPLEQAIYDVLCDVNIFKVGFCDYSAQIAKIVKPHINSNLLNNISDKDFNNNVRQVLETRNNCIRNKYIYKYRDKLEKIPHLFPNTTVSKYYNHLIRRDIATVKTIVPEKGSKGNGRNKYLFGCLLDDVAYPHKP